MLVINTQPRSVTMKEQFLESIENKKELLQKGNSA
jgi:hypothetical protein